MQLWSTEGSHRGFETNTFGDLLLLTSFLPACSVIQSNSQGLLRSRNPIACQFFNQNGNGGQASFSSLKNCWGSLFPPDGSTNRVYGVHPFV